MNPNPSKTKTDTKYEQQKTHKIQQQKEQKGKKNIRHFLSTVHQCTQMGHSVCYSSK